MIAWFRRFAFYAWQRKLQAAEQGGQDDYLPGLAPKAAGLAARSLRELREIRSSSVSYDRDVAGRL
jgi:hypothetical protein